MLLFIASEVMFFVAWFWAYFNSAIFFRRCRRRRPGRRPGIVTLDPWHFPLLNTLILLTSGTTVTWAHHAIQTGDRKGAIQGLIMTVLLGASFTCVQAYEYAHAPFTFGFNNLALVPFTDRGAPRAGRRRGQLRGDLRLDLLHGDRLPRLPRASSARSSWRSACSAPSRASSRRPATSASRRRPGTGTSSTWCGCSSSPASMSGAQARSLPAKPRNRPTHAMPSSGLCPRCGQGPLFEGYIAIAPKPARPAAWTMPCSMPVTGRRCSAS